MSRHGVRLRISALLCVVAMVLSGASPAAAQQAQLPPGGGAWAPGPGASGDRNQLGGVIDTPAGGASVSGPSVQLSGWFVDVSAQGWAGADDVEVFNGTMDVGKFLGHAVVAQNRPDVAAALKTPYWAQSGWSARISTAGLPPGPLTLSVYVHTASKGWWSRQVNVTLGPTNAPPRGAPAPTIYGNDISSPQCPTGAEPPPPAFAIVGVTGGRPFDPNACLPREFAWALSATSSNQPSIGFYMNTADPGPTASPHWPAAGTTSPRVCDGSWSADCAFDYGWLSAQDAYARAVNVAGAATASQVPWWLDVEAVNSWSPDQAVNVADLQGALAFLQAQNVATVGVYATSTDWDALVGQASSDTPFAGLPNWRPGPNTAQEAPGWCSRTVTGGRVKFVQFPSAGFDTDYACY